MADRAPHPDPVRGPPAAVATATGGSLDATGSAATAEATTSHALSVELQRRNSWLRASAEIGTAVVVDASAQTLLDLVARQARAVTGAQFTAVVVPGDDPGELVVVAVAHATAEDGGTSEPHHRDDLRGSDATRESWLAGRVFAVEDSPCGQVFRSGSTQMITQSTPDSSGWAGTDGVPTPGALLLVPLRSGDQVHGVLAVAGVAATRAFDLREQELAELFAGHAALAIGMCRAAEDRRRLAVCEDRERVARDLHDLVIQRLFAIGLGLQGLAAVAPPELTGRLVDLVGDLDSTIEDLRRTIFALQAPAGRSTSLRAVAVETCSEAAPLLGLEPHLRLEGPLDLATPAVLHPHVLATLREILSNTARHAAASTVEVLLRADVDRARLELTVTDDGRGMPPVPPRRGGLANIAARASLLGGQVAVESESESESGPGTRVHWWVPLAPPPQTGRSGDR